MTTLADTPSPDQLELDTLLAGYLEALERGDAPPLEALLSAYPHLSDRIKAFFADRDLFDSFSGKRSSGAFPRAFGQFTLLAEIARGGMGVVYKARETALNRIVALKMLIAGPFAASLEVQRFRLETEATALLGHPHIVPLYAVGEHCGQHFYTMPYFERGSLATHLERFSRDWKRAARLLYTVTNAIMHAHTRAVLHRDLKPANILLDSNDEPHVADFGLAKLLESDHALTATGVFMGTASYVPPEHATGPHRPATTACDVYGLGLILYEILAGRAAFTGDTPYDILKQVACADPTPPSRIHPSVPRDLETICLKCLAKNPAQRYSSAAALATDIQLYLDNKPITARKASVREKARKFIQRRPAVAGICGVAFIALLVMVGMGVNYNTRLSNTNARLESALLERTRQLYALTSMEAYEAAQRKDFHTVHRLLKELAALNPDGDACGFERSHLVRTSWQQQHALGRDLGPVHWVGFNRQGSLLAALGTQSLSTYECKKFEATPGLPDWPGGLSGAFTPDAAALVIVNRHGSVNAFDLVNRRDLIPREGFAAGSACMALSPDGRLLATGGEEGSVRIWDWKTGTEVAILGREHSRVMSVAFSASGDFLAAAFASGPIRLWKGPPWSFHGPLPGHPGGTTALAFGTKDQSLASAGMDGNARIWNCSTRELDYVLSWTSGPLNAIALSPDSTTLATGGTDRVVRVWDLTRRQLLQALPGHSGSITSLAFSPNGDWIASGSIDGSRLIWRAPRPDDREAREEPAALEGHSDAVLRVALTQDGSKMMTAGADGLVHCWPLDRVEHMPLLTEHAHIEALAPDGSWAAISRNNALCLRPVFSDGTQLTEHPLESGTDNVTVLAAFSNDARMFAALANDGKSIRLWRRTEEDPPAWIEEDACILRIECNRPQYQSPYVLAFSPDNTLLACALSMSFQMNVWSLARRGQPMVLGSNSPATALSFSPDSRWLAVGRGGAVGITDLSPIIHDYTKLELGEDIQFYVNSDPVTALCFTPCGRRLLTGSADGTIKLWHLSLDGADRGTPLCCARLVSHEGPVRSLRFTSDGRTLISAGGHRRKPGEVRLWRSASDGLERSFR